MAVEVVELKGIKSVKALNIYSQLLLGYKMLPIHIDKTYDEFLEYFSKLDENDKRIIIKQALSAVNMEDTDITTLTSFAKDENGVLYTKSVIDHLPANKIVEVAAEVCMALDRLEVFFYKKTK